MPRNVTGVVELSITPLDQYYYVSRESGDRFSTKPYIMHSALFYALGLLPTRFRVSDQTPVYTTHYERSEAAEGIYIHPATIVGGGRHMTRRFSVKGDTYRSEAQQENKNLLETGHQRTYEPNLQFRTFVTCSEGTDAPTFAQQLPSYIRVGKKMTSARLEADVHDVTPKEGRFTLDQPVGKQDISTDGYDILGSVHMESMAPVDLLTQSDLSGQYVSVDPRFGSEHRDMPVTLPTDVCFLGIGQ